MATPIPVQTPVVITAMGCVSPLGCDTAAMTSTLRSATDCITPVERFDVSACQGRTAGQVPDDWLTERCRDSDDPEDFNRAACMMLSAIREARSMHPEFVPELAVIGTTSGGMLLGEKFFRAAAAQVYPRNAAQWVRSYVPQAPVLDALQAEGWDAPCRILSNACASGTNALGHALSQVRSGRHKRVLCGGYDVLCQLVFAGFDALRAYTPELCRPFDRDRTGLVLGEGAAVFFVETAESAARAGRPVLAELAGYGCSTDNHHLTQPNPDGSGPRRAMQNALADAGVEASSVDYINAHGTATPFNDACEGLAIHNLCPRAKVSSTKGQMGHSLGAAGAVEAAICIRAMQEQFLPANINFRSGDPDRPLNLVANQCDSTTARTVLSNSLGFGGANATILLKASQL